MFTNQGTMVQFNYPEIQDSRQQTCSPMQTTQRQKQPTGMLPGILTQCDADGLTSLRRLAEALLKQSVRRKSITRHWRGGG